MQQIQIVKQGLSKHKKDLLREFVDWTCEECHRHENIVGRLTIHRINRGYCNGEYSLRNIKVVCNYPGLIGGKKSCHKIYHSMEFRR